MYANIENAQLLTLNSETKKFKDGEKVTTYESRKAEILVLSPNGNAFETFNVSEDDFNYLMGMKSSSSNGVLNGTAVIKVSKRNNGGYNASLCDFITSAGISNKK